MNPASTSKTHFHQSIFYLRKVIFIFLRGKSPGVIVRGKCPRPGPCEVM